MPIQADVTVALNLTIGSVPVGLQAHLDKTATGTDLVFDGSISGITISLTEFLTEVASEFGIETGVPVELDLAANLDHLVARIARISASSGPSTRVLVAGRFELESSGRRIAGLDFYADVASAGVGSGRTPFAVGAAFDTALDLADLPVVGSIPALADLSLRHLGFFYASSDPATPGQSRTLLLPTVVQSTGPGGEPYRIASSTTPELTIDGGGFSLTAALVDRSTGAAQTTLSLPLTPAQNKAPSAAPAPPVTSSTPAVPSSASAIPIRWVEINKTFGPVNLAKIGVNYGHGQASFGLSAGLALASFALQLDGLEITFPLPLPGQPAGTTIAFDLAGLSFDFQRGGLELGAAFLRVDEGGHPAFYGEVIVKIATFGLKAIGGYTPASAAGPASFFLYANLTVPLGGPPFLFITGFAGGFGMNRSLVLPTFDNLGTYILLPDNAPAEGESASATIKTVIPQLQSIFREEPGEYWVAAGISFTSFEMIDAFALVTVAFGVEMQIAVLGSCAMTFPKGSQYPMAFIQVNLLASFTPSSGLLAVIGELTPSSFVYGGLVHITGGFAFYIWFDGPHAGEFVVSIGGYHPSFVRPDHYPAVPRLQMQFALGPLSVTGQAYFALTPAMMMAGLSMRAVWSSGGIRAWLDAGVDVLVGWLPFHYEARVYISIGCSVDLELFTLDVEVGAELMIWGPPFGGRADVDLDVASFTLSFGAPQIPPPPVGWDEFRTGLLPKDTTPKGPPTAAQARAAASPAGTASAATVQNVVTASVESGLLQTDVSGLDWIIDPDSFSIVTNSAIPANTARWSGSQGQITLPNSAVAFTASASDPTMRPALALAPGQGTASDSEVWQAALGVRPMTLQHVTSVHTVTLTKQEISGLAPPIDSVTVQPVLLDVNAAMWADTPAATGPNDARVVPRALVGLRIQAIKRHPATVSNVPLDALLYQRGYGFTFSYAGPAPDPGFTVSIAATAADALDITISGAAGEEFDNAGFVLSALAAPWLAERRAGVATELATVFGTRGPESIDVTTMATATAWTDWPGVAVLDRQPVARPANAA